MYANICNSQAASIKTRNYYFLMFAWEVVTPRRARGWSFTAKMRGKSLYPDKILPVSRVGWIWNPTLNNYMVVRAPIPVLLP